MTEVIVIIALTIALTIWIASTEIRIHQLYFRNKFLMERVVDVDARMCIMEEKVTE